MPLVRRQIHSCMMVSDNINFPRRVDHLIRWCADVLDEHEVFCGHGTDNTVDEAAVLVFFVMGLNHDEAAAAYGQVVTPEAFTRLEALLRRRVEERIPTPYLTGEAWFAGLPFRVDRRVLIPRSPFAELIGSRFEPWLDARRIRRILEIGTGSGCIAIACAKAFPDAEIVATDIDTGALAVARANIDDHGVQEQVSLVGTDLFAGLQGRYDLIVSNPPYVPRDASSSLPQEYHHEPGLALYSGADGLESPRRILQDAPRYLNEGGTLALEVGAGSAALDAAFPDLPFIWPEFEFGGEGIALIGAADLAKANID